MNLIKKSIHNTAILHLIDITHRKLKIGDTFVDNLQGQYQHIVTERIIVSLLDVILALLKRDGRYYPLTPELLRTRN